MRCAVIISTYNNFDALEKCLWGFEAQRDTDFAISIADDGSDETFRARLTRYLATSPLRVTHHWHPDEGFRKSVILNTAIRAATADYLIFTDGDMIPRDDFVANHRALARPGRFLSGGSQLDLPREVHATLSAEVVKSQSLFNAAWLRAHGMTSAKHYWRLTMRWPRSLWLDALTPRINALCGCNASAFRADVLAVRGFDETFHYGGLDRDLGIRLANAGVRGMRHQFSLCCVHLAHGRPYRDEETVRRQRALLRSRMARRVIHPDQGIE